MAISRCQDISLGNLYYPPKNTPLTSTFTNYLNLLTKMSSSTSPSASASPPTIPPLNLIIRFTTSLPDLPLTIPHPRLTTPSTLSTLIRPHLPFSLCASPIRLIHSGALLPAHTPLSTSLRLSPTGKFPASIYIHCSISSERTLTGAELVAEERDATALQRQAAAEDPQDTNDDEETSSPGLLQTTTTTNASSSTTPAPQGFDRLLLAGLTPTEVSALRSQFFAIQAHTHTPDTMPSAAELRLLEERWLDAGNTPNGAITGEGGVGMDDENGGGGLEDMLWGNVMGFFWAVGAIVWLVREEGVWSKRRQIGVVTGVLVNIAFCVLRVGS